MYIRKQRDKWRVEIERLGVRKSAVFETKTEAREWGVKEEAALMAAKRGVFPKRTLSDAIDAYLEKVSALKAGSRWEELRLRAVEREFPQMARKVLSRLTTTDLAAWRDQRLTAVSKGTVQREINLLSHVFTKARDEWKWMGESPFVGMQSPGDNPSRDRLPTPTEIKRIARWLGYVTGERPKTKQAQAALAFLLALRTGMRAGEVLQLGSKTVHGAVATVKHKMQHRTGKPRQVPLSRHALRLLKGFRGFTITSASLDALFRKARDSLLIEDLHFHDARAYALTAFSKKVDVFELARISGHKDVRILLTTYYRTSSADIAARL